MVESIVGSMRCFSWWMTEQNSKERLHPEGGRRRRGEEKASNKVRIFVFTQFYPRSSTHMDVPMDVDWYHSIWWCHSTFSPAISTQLQQQTPNALIKHQLFANTVANTAHVCTQRLGAAEDRGLRRWAVRSTTEREKALYSGVLLTNQSNDVHHFESTKHRRKSINQSREAAPPPLQCDVTQELLQQLHHPSEGRKLWLIQWVRGEWGAQPSRSIQRYLLILLAKIKQMREKVNSLENHHNHNGH